MLKYNRFAFLNLENQIYQGFQTPAGPINLKPLQGLKQYARGILVAQLTGPNQPQTLTGIETFSIRSTHRPGFGPINLKPLQGLKHYPPSLGGETHNGPINLKPLQGLKLCFGHYLDSAGCGPINLKPLQGLKRALFMGGVSFITAQSTSNPYRD